MTRFRELDADDYALSDSIRDGILSPALVVYLEKVRENLRRVIAATGGADRWRPHVKTSKIPAVWAEIARAGVRHFKCATTREAEHLLAVLREEGVEGGDVCLAHPLVGPALGVLGRLAAAHPQARVSVLCEDPDALGSIPRGVSVFVDVNPGMNRTGVPFAERETILALAERAGDRFRGIHWYEGHLHDPDLEARRRSIFDCYDRLMELLEAMRAAGHAVPEIVTSGTPSFLHALTYPPFRELESGRHRVSPGTVVYHDLRSEEENPDLDLVPAALVFTRVVSHPAAGIVTCDAGSKSVAAEAGDPCALVLGRPELVALAPSEEHLPLRITSGRRPPRGASLLLVPRHVCPTVNLAEEVLIVDRDGGATIAEVRARAHSLSAHDQELGARPKGPAP